LAAFLDLYLNNASQELRLATIAAMTWAMPREWLKSLDVWHDHSKAWRTHILKKQEDGGLAARLMRFIA
jgi:hypothetical protein